MTDEELVESSLRYEEAFYTLMKRYEPVLLRYINRMTRAGREEAEDLIQDIFIKVYRNLNGFDTGLKFSTWVYRIAHNEIISQYRKKKGEPLSVEPGEHDEDAGSLSNFLTDTFNTEARVINREKAVAVRRALDRLPEKYRVVLLLYYFEELSYTEISDILKKPSGSIATLLNRAKDKFKKIAEQNRLESIY